MSSSVRLDQYIVKKGLVSSRSQAESYIRMGDVTVNGNVVTKTGYQVGENDSVKLNVQKQYVSRAGLKLASIAKDFNLDFRDKVVLDVGSSTGGFTDYALKHGAVKVIAVEVGTNQLHPTLRGNEKIELHEQTDIRNIKSLSSVPDYVVIDVSFISLRDILPHISKITPRAQILAMVKPQFEAAANVKHKGVIKNEKIRREILKNFESWALRLFKINAKSDSQVAGEKGNKERFYSLQVLPRTAVK